MALPHRHFGIEWEYCGNEMLYGNSWRNAPLISGREVRWAGMCIGVSTICVCSRRRAESGIGRCWRVVTGESRMGWSVTLMETPDVQMLTLHWPHCIFRHKDSTTQEGCEHFHPWPQSCQTLQLSLWSKVTEHIKCRLLCNKNQGNSRALSYKGPWGSYHSICLSSQRSWWPVTFLSTWW